MGPQLLGLTKKHGDKVVVLKVNVDKQKTLASMAGVRSIPDRRLYFAGSQLERGVGGVSSMQLEQMVLKHERKLPVPKEAAAPPVQKISGSTIRRQKTVVNDKNQLEWPEGKTPDVKKEEAKPAGKDALKSGTIEPMEKDWLPPGVTPAKS